MWVLVPAHDEEEGITQAVTSILHNGYDAGSLRTVVIADNCSDSTAARAREAGAVVWERTDTTRRGKGQALAWAAERMTSEPEVPDGVVVVDADCRLEPGALGALAGALAGGADAAQASYAIHNADSSEAAALRAAAFSLMNDVRPRGKEAAGLSAGLLGTGMAFTTDTLRAVPWEAFSITEDREYHLRLLEAGRPVRFVAHARVTTPAPTNREGVDTQERRWDAGNVELARRWVPRVLRSRTLRPAERVVTTCDLLTPPQSAITGLWGASLALGFAARSRRGVRLAVAAAAAQALYVLGGLIVAGAPAAAWRALPRAPLLVARRLLQLVGVVRTPPTEWERTERDA